MLRSLLRVVSWLSLLGPISSFCPRGDPQFPVRNVVFENVTLLGATKLQDIAGEIGAGYQVGGAAARIRTEYERRGFLRPQITEQALPVSDDQAHRYDIVVRIVDAGKLYRVGDVSFLNATVFSAATLRALFPMRGDAFEMEKVRKGLRKMRSLYGTRGYFGAYARENEQLDERDGIVNLQIRVSESKSLAEMFRISTPDLDRSPSSESEVNPVPVFLPKSWILDRLKFNDRDYRSDQHNRTLPAWLEKEWDPYDQYFVYTFRATCATALYTCEFKGSTGMCRPKMP